MKKLFKRHYLRCKELLAYFTVPALAGVSVAAMMYIGSIMFAPHKGAKCIDDMRKRPGSELGPNTVMVV